jgi:predicted alpha/beta superfamily hydrolase
MEHVDNSYPSGDEDENLKSDPHGSRKRHKHYLTAYVLDGNLFTGIISGITRVMESNPNFPELLVVGIGYPLDGLYGENGRIFQTIRTKDFTPIRDAVTEEEKKRALNLDSIQTGGAKDFVNFLTEELMPKIESTYRAAAENRVVVGDSLGGLFALYTLFQRLQLFRNYIIGSPTLGYGNKVLFKIEEEHSKQTNELEANVFMGIGGEEEIPFGMLSTISVSDFYKFTSIVQYRGYRGINLKRKVFEGNDHFAVPALVFQAGLKHVFKYGAV